MLHAHRVWCVSEVGSAEELAKNLTETAWCRCQAFSIAGYPRYIWLNDSTSSDGAQEFAVVRLTGIAGWGRQLESITFGWSDYANSLVMIRATLNGEDDQNSWSTSVKVRLQSPEEHGRCSLCA